MKRRRIKRRSNTRRASVTGRVSEYDEQVVIFEWAKWMEKTVPELWLLNSSQNGARVTPGTAMKMKNSGMKRGFPDVFLPVSRHGKHGIFIELKARDRPAAVSDHQLEWITRLLDEGYAASICYGANEAIDTLIGYLDLDTKEHQWPPPRGLKT